MGTKVLTTSHTALKKKMLEAGIKKHQSVIDDFNQSIKSMLASEGIVNEEEMDLSQQGFNTEIVQRVNNLADQLEFANEEMKLLFDMQPTIEYVHNTVQPGSVVVTDKDIFFVSVSIERFEVEGLSVFGLSTESPIYQEMKGLKKGDVFSYKKTRYKISDVF
ncbi:hypothetical protein C900_02423 [Fulvivirga imtechensis AK7]|uniref:Transcription elongation factor n=1 Tax=Fulvivirga imtechensis AK7 TaxID=1237149 RepID=L8JRX2_9BACT|nr:hypothetical protein [Fulvivirga imtechensis]ELR71615.1 hypothetical protein C900_02423 [Fulvivirga imtechensis AK7]